MLTGIQSAKSSVAGRESTGLGKLFSDAFAALFQTTGESNPVSAEGSPGTTASVAKSQNTDEAPHPSTSGKNSFRAKKGGLPNDEPENKSQSADTTLPFVVIPQADPATPSSKFPSAAGDSSAATAELETLLVSLQPAQPQGVADPKIVPSGAGPAEPDESKLQRATGVPGADVASKPPATPVHIASSESSKTELRVLPPETNPGRPESSAARAAHNHESQPGARTGSAQQPSEKGHSDQEPSASVPNAQPANTAGPAEGGVSPAKTGLSEPSVKLPHETVKAAHHSSSETPREPVPDAGDSPGRQVSAPGKEDSLKAPLSEQAMPTVSARDAQLAATQPTTASQQISSSIVHASPQTGMAASEAPTYPAGDSNSAGTSTAKDTSTSSSAESALADARTTPGAVHLMTRVEHQELRFGWTSQEFGRIEVRTTLEHNRVGATISAPDSQLRESLREHVASLDHALSGHTLELSSFTTSDNSASQEGRRDQASQQTAGQPLWRPREEKPNLSASTDAASHQRAGRLDLRA